MASPFSSPEAQINRDRWQRPLIVPPNGGPVEPYQRVTTFAKIIEDASGLNKWHIRRIVYGLSQRPDLVLAASAAGPDAYRDLMRIADKAEEHVDSGAASTGTALHSFIERIDNGQELGFVPPNYIPDLRAYEALVKKHKIEVQASERFVVYDPFAVGGTFDKIMTVGSGVEHIGVPAIGDNKTGKVDYPLGMAVQLGVYSRSRLYDIGMAQRLELATLAGGKPIDQDHGYIIWLPAGTGHAELLTLDIAMGWEAAEVAVRVRAIRKHKAWFLNRTAVELSLEEQIDAAATQQELRALYERNTTRWHDGLTARAGARSRVLAHN
jgi:hypothetical protein